MILARVSPQEQSLLERGLMPKRKMETEAEAHFYTPSADLRFPMAAPAAQRRQHVAVGVSPWNPNRIRSKKPRSGGSNRRVQYGRVSQADLPFRVQHKTRRRLIRHAFQERLYEYMGGIIRGQKGHLIEIGGIEDHVHLLANLSPANSVSDSIRGIKANASKWANELPEVAFRFEWQKGYGAFTVSYSQINAVRRYIQNQREHHRTITFEQENIELLKRHDIEFEPKYLFESEHYG